MSSWHTGESRAWNNTPDSTGPRQGRLSQMGKEKATGTRCNHYIDGTILCDAFPSWPVPGTKRERRCEEHKNEGVTE